MSLGVGTRAYAPHATKFCDGVIVYGWLTAVHAVDMNTRPMILSSRILSYIIYQLVLLMPIVRSSEGLQHPPLKVQGWWHVWVFGGSSQLRRSYGKSHHWTQSAHLETS